MSPERVSAPAAEKEASERLAKARQDGGPLGSGVCALQIAAEAQSSYGSVAIYRDEARALLGAIAGAAPNPEPRYTLAEVADMLEKLARDQGGDPEIPGSYMRAARWLRSTTEEP